MNTTAGAVLARSVDRALRLLEALNRQQVSSVNDLYRETRIPKPTIVRILHGMIGAGYVVGDSNHGGYRVAARVQSLSSGFHSDALVVEAGRAWAIGITRRVKWPVAIALLDQDAMVVRFSTIPESPISPLYSTINQRFSLIYRAIGRAYLAFCSEDERNLLLSLIAASDNSEKTPIGLRELQGVLATIRNQGFAERAPQMPPLNSSSVAVPIIGQDRILATLGITYFTSAAPRKVVIGEYVPLLQETAQAIASQICSILRPS